MHYVPGDYSIAFDCFSVELCRRECSAMSPPKQSFIIRQRLWDEGEQFHFQSNADEKVLARQSLDRKSSKITPWLTGIRIRKVIEFCSKMSTRFSKLSIIERAHVSRARPERVEKFENFRNLQSHFVCGHLSSCEWKSFDESFSPIRTEKRLNNFKISN